MISTKDSYRRVSSLLDQVSEQIRKKRAALRAEGLSEKEIDLRTLALRQQRQQLLESISLYEATTRQNPREFKTSDFSDVGWLLTRMRVAAGLTQRELAERLGIEASGISHAERDGYDGLTLKRAARILQALNVPVQLTLG